MIGRSICHFLTLKYEQWKFRRLGFHVITVDRSPDFMLESDYRVTLIKRKRNVAILFAHPFEYTLRGYNIAPYYEEQSNTVVGQQAGISLKSYTGITFSNSHMFKAIKIGLPSKYKRQVEHDHESTA